MIGRAQISAFLILISYRKKLDLAGAIKIIKITSVVLVKA